MKMGLIIDAFANAAVIVSGSYSSTSLCIFVCLLPFIIGIFIYVVNLVIDIDDDDNYNHIPLLKEESLRSIFWKPSSETVLMYI